MVRVSSHGGMCCGARHLFGFGAAEDANPGLINSALQDVPPERLAEIILNGDQVRQYPNILARLADLGFVLDGHWINGNHNSHNYRFSRCDNRLPLNLDNWNGMIMSPGLHGRLPPVPRDRTVNNNGIAHHLYVRPLLLGTVENTRIRHNYLCELSAYRRNSSVGKRFRINSPRSRYNGQSYICIGRGPEGSLAFRSPVTGRRFYIAQNNCVPVDARAGPPAVPEGNLIREFQVGDRVQLVHPWGAVPQGLVGTCTRVLSEISVEIQFDTPGSNIVTSMTSYISIVDHEAQPDIPRERIPPPPPEPVRPAPDPAPHRHENPVFAVFSTFHCVSSRDGTRGAGFDTLEEACANLGKRTRVDRRDIMSQGDPVWVANVNT